MITKKDILKFLEPYDDDIIIKCAELKLSDGDWHIDNKRDILSVAEDNENNSLYFISCVDHVEQLMEKFSNGSKPK